VRRLLCVFTHSIQGADPTVQLEDARVVEPDIRASETDDRHGPTPRHRSLQHQNRIVRVGAICALRRQNAYPGTTDLYTYDKLDLAPSRPPGAAVDLHSRRLTVCGHQMALFLGTRSTKRKHRKQPIMFLDRVELRFSTYKYVDEIWIGTWENDPVFVLRRVEEALDLIKTYDRLRYDRIIRDLERVWIRTLFGNEVQYSHAINTCELDVPFVVAATSSPAIVAANHSA
jgi:hypothetical protein